MKSVRRIAALILCAALVFSTGISAASYGGAKHETVSSADESGLAAALTQKTKSRAREGEKPGTLTECGGTCEYSPTVVIHGIGQSKTYLYENDEIAVDEDGKQITGWPIYANTKYIIKIFSGRSSRCSSPSAMTALSSHSKDARGHALCQRF